MPGLSELVRPALVALKEDPGSRSVLVGEFGEPGSLWWTTVGVTLADESRMVRGRGWYGGEGEWIPPRGLHPIPLGLQCSLTVASSTLSKDLLPPEVQELPSLGLARFDIREVSAHLSHRLRGLGDVTPESLVPRLREFMAVVDPDE